MEKLLPIKFFEKRKIDELLTEGGGGGSLPKWVLQDDGLSQHSNHLANGVNHIAESFSKRKDESHELPLVIATTVSEKAIAKSYRSSIVNLLNSDNNTNVIGVEAMTAPKENSNETENSDEEGIAESQEEPAEHRRILSIVTSDVLITNIGRALRDTQNSAVLISSISDVEVFEANSESYNPQNKAYRVRLIDYQDQHRNRIAQKLFKNQCGSHGITIERESRYSSDMYMYRVAIDDLSHMEALGKFEGIYSIEEAIPLTSDMDFFDGRPVPERKTPSPDKTYPVIGVLDSGIKPNKYLAPWIMPQNIEYYGEDLQDKGHGSMVASILEYSDELNGTNNYSTDGVMLFESVVVPNLQKEKAYPEDILDNVRDAIERHRDIKVWTMSVGTTEESNIDSFSAYGMALDNIADENGVLIVKSAGNTTAFAHGKTERIAKMADSVRSLVIGSIAGDKGQFDAAEINMPSPFTRIGPGPEYIIKPDLVAYGGNAGILPNGHITTTGVKVFDGDGKPTLAPGTSFSTPWVARIASELEYLLEGEFDPLLIKALLVHGATYPMGGKLPMEDKRKFIGFGLPRGTRDILYNSENEITLILRDKLQKGTFIEILEFPFPKSLVGDDGLYRGQITLTLVGNPLLKTTEGPEYCQSDVQVAFGTMESVQERDTSKRTVRNAYGPKDNQNLLLNSLYSKKYFDVLEDEETENHNFARERTLLQMGSKFHPIKKYAVDLDELKPANRKNHLSQDYKWYLKISTLFRDASERLAEKNGENLEQDFCMILTIRDPLGKTPVYNEVTQQLQVEGFVYSNVQLKNEIREYVEV